MGEAGGKEQAHENKALVVVHGSGGQLDLLPTLYLSAVRERVGNYFLVSTGNNG